MARVDGGENLETPKIDYSEPLDKQVASGGATAPGSIAIDSNTGYTYIVQSDGSHTYVGHTHGVTGQTNYVSTGRNTLPGNATAGPGFIHYNQQYAPYASGTTIINPNHSQNPPPRLWEPEEVDPEVRELQIEFIENVMFLLVATLDSCDVPNEGGIMDRNEGAELESIIDLGEYEIIIRPKAV